MLRIIGRWVLVGAWCLSLFFQPAVQGVRPVAAYDSPYWLAEYFPNPTLSGSPTLLQAVASIDFDWGRSAPGASLPADGFSARWTRPVELPHGVYRITVRADDGVRVYIDDRLVIDEWRDGALRTSDVDVDVGGCASNTTNARVGRRQGLHSPHPRPRRRRSRRDEGFI